MPVKDAINIIDMLSGQKALTKIKNVAKQEVNIGVNAFDKKLQKTMDNIEKRISDLEGMEKKLEDVATSQIDRSEQQIRNIIGDEVSRIFFRLYAKRNTWT